MRYCAGKEIPIVPAIIPPAKIISVTWSVDPYLNESVLVFPYYHGILISAVKYVAPDGIKV